MHAKIVRLAELIELGYQLRGVEPHLDGGLTMRMRHGRSTEALEFAFYEVPSIHLATKVVGKAG